jgi:SAM-dependent methyltransferase
MGVREAAAQPYLIQGHDRVRATFEEPLLGRLVPRLLDLAGGDAMLDLGCGDGLAGRLGGRALTRYLGLDLDPSAVALPCIAHDLRDGLSGLQAAPFDLYLGYFGIASHLSPSELRRLLREVARHARRGAVVALEALGLYSLEWPRLWNTAPGALRTLPYRLAEDVPVHPWAPAELLALFDDAGIEPLHALDRTLQAGPKTGEGRYWPGLPSVRAGLNQLLCGGAAREELTAALPPLPASAAALVHHELALRRRALVRRSHRRGRALAEAVWRLEPVSGTGCGHGLLAVGRVR